MSEEITPFEPYDCSLGTVTGVEGDVYVIATTDGRSIGIRANGVPSAENVEADIASPAPEPRQVPSPVSPRQIRLALNAAGLRATVDAAIAAADQATQDTWEYTSYVERNDPLVLSMASALGISDDEVDSLFTAAAQY